MPPPCRELAFRAWRRVRPLPHDRLLLPVALLDELAAGVAPTSAPDFLHEFGVSPALAAGWTLLAVTCALAAPLYAVVQAQAFAAMPGRSTTVVTIAAVASGFDLLVPVAIGGVADHWGLRSALASMLLGPLGLAVIAAVSLGRRR